MSDLNTFRDHCRRMTKAQHRPDCTGGPPTCTGCVTDADRALFAQLADEVDQYRPLAIAEPAHRGA